MQPLRLSGYQHCFLWAYSSILWDDRGSALRALPPCRPRVSLEYFLSAQSRWSPCSPIRPLWHLFYWYLSGLSSCFLTLSGDRDYALSVAPHHCRQSWVSCLYQRRRFGRPCVPFLFRSSMLSCFLLLDTGTLHFVRFCFLALRYSGAVVLVRFHLVRSIIARFFLHYFVQFSGQPHGKHDVTFGVAAAIMLQIIGFQLTIESFL